MVAVERSKHLSFLKEISSLLDQQILILAVYEEGNNWIVHIIQSSF